MTATPSLMDILRDDRNTLRREAARKTTADYDPSPMKRERMKRAAAKRVGECSTCRRALPLNPDTGHCWLCDNLNNRTYPRGSTDRQACPRGTSCNDCAFRGDSPEAALDYERYAHLPMPGDDSRSPQSVREMVIEQAKHGGEIFWCHKPFLEPEQEWGYDVRARELVPLHGEHWKPCAGWLKVFDAKWGVKG